MMLMTMLMDTVDMLDADADDGFIMPVTIAVRGGMLYYT
jgi:hypothetical protein